jgi:UDP-N-acetylglucosamine--dolichyl-phosphate N-acetylglucosaminephosphotransferase
MLFLGFADDVLDIRWRVKIWFPLVASIPILIVYYVTYGNTFVLLPIPLRGIFGKHVIELGVFYYVYIGFLSVFSTNAINILAGKIIFEFRVKWCRRCAICYNRRLFGIKFDFTNLPQSFAIGCNAKYHLFLGSLYSCLCWLFASQLVSCLCFWGRFLLLL